MTPDWPVHHHETLDSTSDEARRMVEAGVTPLPFVVRADRQTRGRGRGANTWYSDEGSFLFTVAFDPAAFGIQPRHEPRLAQVAALSVVNAVDNYVLTGCHEAMIRWPNDVEVRGRKLAGILPERIETPQGPRLLIGVGINAATRFETAPDDVRSSAVSLTELEGCRIYQHGSTDLVGPFLREFLVFLTYLIRDDPDLVAFVNTFDALAGKPVRVDQMGRIIEGIGRGIDADGALLLETIEGLVGIVGGSVLRY